MEGNRRGLHRKPLLRPCTRSPSFSILPDRGRPVRRNEPGGRARSTNATVVRTGCGRDARAPSAMEVEGHKDMV